MPIHDVQQGSAKWRELRAGLPTASQFDRIILPSGKRSGQARKYMYQLAYEKITRKPFERDLSNIPHVQHGVTQEATAVAAFEQLTGLKTAPVGFITNEDGDAGCSPDRLIVDHPTMALEVKCPTGPVMAGYLIDGIEDAYRAQIQGQCLIGGFTHVHFFAWSAELPHYARIVERDVQFIILLDQYLREFTTELAAGVQHIRALGHWPRNAPSAFPDDPDDA